MSLYRCPNTDCWWDETKSEKGYCPECGVALENLGIIKSAKIINEKKKFKNDPETINKKKESKELQAEEKRLSRLLFSPDVLDDDLINSIESDMSNLAAHEAGTKWMRIGTLLSFNSTEQMIGAGFKAIIDQNKIKIKQNELILRELKKLNSE